MKKIYIKYGLICVLAWCSFSCNNDDSQELFDDSPAERIEQRNTELLNLLTSQTQGYRGMYFTKNDEFGGFTFYMKFNENGTVDMTSDFDLETTVESSSYEVRLGTTNELVFTTRNHIQKVSDPLFPGLIGSGFKGTSVFQFFSNENGKLIFKDVRNKNTGILELSPTGFSDFKSESVQMAEGSLMQRENIVPTISSSVFQLLTVENSSGISNFDFNYDSLRLFATPRITLSDGSITEYTFGLNFNESGFIISPAFEYQGEIYEAFLYDEGSSSFISIVNGTTASIYFSGSPAYFKPDVNGLGELGRQTYISFLEDGTSPLTSPGFIDLIEILESNVRQTDGFSDWTYNGFVYFSVPDSDGDVRLDILFTNPNNTAIERAIFWFTPLTQDNKLFLSFTGFTNQLGLDLFGALEPMVQFFASPEGLYYTDEGSFITDSVAYGNSAATFTSLSEPNLRIYGLWLN